MIRAVSFSAKSEETWQVYVTANVLDLKDSNFDFG